VTRTEGAYRTSPAGRRVANAQFEIIPVRAINEHKTLALGWLCEHCGATDDLTLNHLVAVARGGSHDVTNAAVLCRRCNARKGDSRPGSASSRRPSSRRRRSQQPGPPRTLRMANQSAARVHRRGTASRRRSRSCRSSRRARPDGATTKGALPRRSRRQGLRTCSYAAARPSARHVDRPRLTSLGTTWPQNARTRYLGAAHTDAEVPIRAHRAIGAVVVRYALGSTTRCSGWVLPLVGGRAAAAPARVCRYIWSSNREARLNAPAELATECGACPSPTGEDCHDSR
jgi:HNH endonuclease